MPACLSLEPKRPPYVLNREPRLNHTTANLPLHLSMRDAGVGFVQSHAHLLYVLHPRCAIELVRTVP